MKEKWICNKCGYETTEQPECRNTTCDACHKGRFQLWKHCECRKWFHPQTSKQNYCSRECGYRNRHSDSKAGKHYPYLQKARIATCPVCGKEFRAVKDWKEKHAIYCSKECWSRRASVTTNCAYCGKEIKTYTSGAKRFCSKACRDLEYRNRTGKRAQAWKGGRTAETKCRRTSAAYREWRTAVFERDNYTCQMCGKRGGYLEAHHIKEACNYPELIFEVENGQTLCHECHKLTDNYASKAKKAVLLNGDRKQIRRQTQ